jgi:hypothetical protein
VKAADFQYEPPLLLAECGDFLPRIHPQHRQRGLRWQRGGIDYPTRRDDVADPGEVTASLVYDPTDASHTRLARYMKNRITANFKICEVSTGGSVSSFTGYIKAMSREIPMDDVITCDVTFKVSGLPGYTT